MLGRALALPMVPTNGRRRNLLDGGALQSEQSCLAPTCMLLGVRPKQPMPWAPTCRCGRRLRMHTMSLRVRTCSATKT